MLHIKTLIISTLKPIGGGILIFLLCFLFRMMQPAKKVHISFDDVSLENSIELNKFVQRLQIFHSLYGAKFSFYTFDAPENIQRNEVVKDASDWLKFSYHGSNEPFDTLATKTNYVNNLNNQLNLLRHMGGESCLSTTVRLHYFFGDSVMLNIANSNGVTTFLSADEPGRISYALDSCAGERLYRFGYLTNDNNKYYRTDIRLERTTLWDCITNGNLSDTTLVIFTHQVKFDRKAEIKMHLLMMFLWLNNYEFLTDL